MKMLTALGLFFFAHVFAAAQDGSGSLVRGEGSILLGGGSYSESFSLASAYAREAASRLCGGAKTIQVSKWMTRERCGVSHYGSELCRLQVSAWFACDQVGNQYSAGIICGEGAWERFTCGNQHFLQCGHGNDQWTIENYCCACTKLPF